MQVLDGSEVRSGSGRHHACWRGITCDRSDSRALQPVPAAEDCDTEPVSCNCVATVAAKRGGGLMPPTHVPTVVRSP